MANRGNIEDTSLEKSPVIQFFNRKTIICCPLRTSSRQLLLLVDGLEGLKAFQKQSLIVRYISITEEINRRKLFYAWIFHCGRFTVTIGSLIVPALLSIQYTNSGTTSGSISMSSLEIYWATWVISLLVTMCNGVLTLFKVDKKYYFLHTVLEHLQSELWQYIHLTSKYGGYYTRNKVPTYANQYVFLCHNMEKIKLKQVEEEYYKLMDTQSSTDKHHTVDVSGSSIETSKMVGGLFVPTPSTEELLQKQKELAKAIGLEPKNTLVTIQEDQYDAKTETITDSSSQVQKSEKQKAVWK